jgi:cytochrome P450
VYKWMLLLFDIHFDPISIFRFAAGYTISYALLELSKHKDIQTQLRNELKGGTKDPKDNKLIDSPLLKRVVKETLRLWPVAAGGGIRMVSDDVVVKADDGKGGKRLMTLPKGSFARFVSYALLRDDDVFDQADEWIPDRWITTTDEMKTSFMPFMVGRRSCPGQLLALTEAEVFLTRLLQEYEWSIVKETEPRFAITLKVEGIILQARKVF